MNTAELTRRLAARYSPPEYAFFTEIGIDLGRTTRFADGLALGLWPSRGLRLLAFEVKADRRDFLRELKKPAKAEAIARQCDAFFLVTPKDGVVKDPEEIPEGWGWLVPRGKGLTTKRKATFKDPDPLMHRRIVATMIRRSHELVQQAQNKRDWETEAKIRDAVLNEVEAGKAWKTEKDMLEQRLAHAQADRKAATDALAEVKQWTGTDAQRSWSQTRLAQELKMLRAYHPEGVRRHMERNLRTLRAAVAQVETALEKTKP